VEKTKVLIVDDEPEIRELFVDTLSPLGYNVLTAADGKTAITIVEKHQPKVAFIDIRMPGMDGVELLGHLKTIAKDIRVIMITGYGRDEAVERALQLGTFACLMKPFSLRDIIEMTEIVQMAA
jgi:two-component system response regulator (stage 0 sporulation protein F)